VNAPLRRTGVVVLVLFALLFANLNYVQAYKADDYRTSQYNRRVQIAEYTHPRGKISLANTVVADSKETTDNLKYLRTYPFGPTYAHIVGYRPVNLGATDLERLENDFLTGNADIQAGERLTALFTGKRASGGIVQLTISQAAQDAATRELARNQKKSTKGAIVALDPTTGKLLASVSMPSFDPNPLVSHDTRKAQAAYNTLNADPDRPLNDRALAETYPAGSTFKVIMSAAAIADVGLKPDSQITGGDTYQPPQTTQPIKNVTGEDCGEQLTLAEALKISCNTAFARLGVEQVHADKLKDMAQAFGFETEPKFVDDEKNIIGTAASHTGAIAGPDGRVDQAALAQSSIGQRDVRMTPLQGAMIAATVANGGRQMRPYVIERLQSSDLSTVKETVPKELNRPIDGNVASALQDMMVGVVDGGTGTNAKKAAATPGLRIGGKTGTAENAPKTPEHGWFIGWAMRDNKPLIAVAVLLENAGNGGSAEAARICGLVMKAYADSTGGK
jgi:peptidoglycan glycosyltransferase